MALGSNNPFPSELFVEGSAPASPAATNFRLYFDSADHLLKWKNSAGTVTTIATGASSMTNPMTTTQDIIVGGASGTPGRLAAGAAGGALVSLNSVLAWNSGTSMPANKATGDRYWRTDLGIEAFYDGTRWLALGQPQIVTFGWENMTASGTIPSSRFPLRSDFDIYVIDLVTTTVAFTTNNGTNFYTMRLQKTNGANADTVVATTVTSADTAGTWTNHITSINAVIDYATYKSLYFDVIKTLSPGALYGTIGFTYRRVVA